MSSINFGSQHCRLRPKKSDCDCMQAFPISSDLFLNTCDVVVFCPSPVNVETLNSGRKKVMLYFTHIFNTRTCSEVSTAAVV